MSCLEAIGRFVSEFARFILFFASIIFLLSSGLLLVASYHGRNDIAYIQLADINTVLSIVIGFSIYLIVLSIIGIFASFFSNKSTIKLLVLMTTLNVIIGIAVLSTSSPKFDSVHESLLSKLKSYQKDYDWTHSSSASETARAATKAWDTIQADLNCCGLKSSADWAEFNPHQADKTRLPKSCCLSTNTTTYCDSSKDQIWTNGCVESMEAAIQMVMDMVIFMVCFSLIVGLLASVVLCCKPKARHNVSGAGSTGYRY